MSCPKQGCPGPAAGMSQLVPVPGTEIKYDFGRQTLNGVLPAYPTPLGIWGPVPEGAPREGPKQWGCYTQGHVEGNRKIIKKK